MLKLSLDSFDGNWTSPLANSEQEALTIKTPAVKDSEIYKREFPRQQNLFDTDTVWQPKQDLIQQLISVAPRVQHRLDTSRISNVLTEMNVQLGIALFLPVLLFCENREKVEQLGEDIGRTLQLMKLQLELANSESMDPENSKTGLDTNEIHRDLGSTSHLFALKETFYTLCVNFRNTFDYRHLKFAQKLFATEIENSEMFPLIRRLQGFQTTSSLILEIMTAVTKNIIKNSYKTPYENRQMHRKIAAMNSAEENALLEKNRVLLEYEKQISSYKSIYEILHKRIRTNQETIFRKLQEVRDKRVEIQEKINTRREKERHRHSAKMARLSHNNDIAVQESKKLKQLQYQMSRYYIKKIKDQEDKFREQEFEVIQNNVALKSELLGIQANLEWQRNALEVLSAEEEVTHNQFKELLQEINLNEAKRLEQEIEHKKLTAAAVMIQKMWRGYAHRKTYKKLKSDKLNRKNKKNKNKKASKK